MDLGALNVVVAFAAGVLSFASPCVLSLVPAYLGYIAGVSVPELAGGDSAVRRRAIANALAFVVGLALVFTLLGATATTVGQLLLAYRVITTKVAGLLIIIFGLHMSGLLTLPFLYRERRIDFLAARQRGGYFGAFLMGGAFAIGWTPCVGVILGSILLAASQSETVFAGMLLLFVYSLGLGLPFVFAALAVQRFLGVLKSARRHLHRLSFAGGVVVMAMGVLVFSDRLSLLSTWFFQTFGPGLTI